jgi:ATP-dependent DNA helicase RecG
MRPAMLDALFAPLTSLKGIGPKLAKPLALLLGHEPPRIIDVLFHLPYSAIDRRARPKLNEVKADTIATLKIVVDRHIPGRGRAPHKIITSDETTTLEIVYFNLPRDRIEKMLPVGETRYVSGRVGLYDGRLQMVHPDMVVDEKGLATLPAVEPVYSLTAGLGPAIIRRAVSGSLTRLRDLPEWLDPAFLKARKFSSFAASLLDLHTPQEPGDVGLESLSRSRLA